MNEMVDSLNDALTGFRLDARCVDARQHRHFGLFDVKLGPKCQISKLSRLSGEIALKIRSRGNPIVKALPSEGIVRLQAVMSEPELLSFWDYNPGRPANPGSLPFVLGCSDGGTPVWVDMAQNPHLLIAGQTNSGKSVLLHTLIANTVRTPNVSLFLSDPKTVEFSEYNDECFSNVVENIDTTYHDTINTLEYLVQQMELRYTHLSAYKLQNIEQMRFPFKRLIVIIDEAAELMMADGSGKFERLVIRLAQKGRAAGIYLVLATQHPSVDVLTGQIKANFPARISCKVASRVNSQVILDHPGAELLAGQGDAIIRNSKFDSVRFQVSYTNAKQIKRNYIKMKS